VESVRELPQPSAAPAPAVESSTAPALGGRTTSAAPEGRTTPDLGGSATSAPGGGTAPALEDHSGPALGGRTAPALGGRTAPALGGRTAPALGGRTAPALGGRSVLEGAFTLLDAVAKGGESGLTRLAAATGLPKTTAYRLLEQLVALGAVERSGGTYRMGSRVFRLGQRWQPHPGLLTAASGPVHALARATGASVGICVLREGQTMAVGGVPGEVDELAPLRPSQTWPWTTAAGRILVAHTRPEFPLGPLPARWRQEAADLRDHGVAIDREELIPGVCCVAAPVRDARGNAVAALCALIAPSPRLRRLEEAVTRLSRSISTTLR
jgi:IclR family transcriptional regulator, acetate operon repressor